jgi:O-antigen/teichoic acid export membrane protein
MLNKIFLFSWPFILSSIFSWTIISLDKFVGAKKLTESSDIAFLALSMQLVIPIAVFADMIRMALGPYIMSIRQDSDSEKSYQQLFEGTIFFASLIVVCLILATPFLTLFLSDKSYLPVISVVPLMAFGQLVSITANQFSICFSLAKKTVYILYSVILGGSAGFIINFFLMEEFGYEVSGYSQVLSYSLMAIFLFYFGKKVANLQIQFKNSSLIITIVFAYIIAISYVNPFKIITNYINLLLVSFITLLLITIIYFVQQKISLRMLLKLFKKT